MSLRDIVYGIGWTALVIGIAPCVWGWMTIDGWYNRSHSYEVERAKHGEVDTPALPMKIRLAWVAGFLAPLGVVTIAVNYIWEKVAA